MKFSEINASQIYFWIKDISGCEDFLSKIRRLIKLQKKKPIWKVSSIFDVKYFFNKRTVTQIFRNPVKYNWNSTRKTKMKMFLGFILQDITPWNHKSGRNCYFGGYFGDLGTNVEFNVFYDFVNIWKFQPLSFGYK